MNSRNEIVESSQFPEEDQLIPKIKPIENELLDDLREQLVPKTEPIDVDFIKKEEIEEEEEEFFVIPGIVQTAKVDEISVKEETFEDEGNSSSPNVCY